MHIPIIDSHHHVWEKKDIEWLQGDVQPRIFGDYTSIMKDYLIDDYIDDVVDFGVEKSVYIQCNWPISRYLDEAKFIDNCYNHSGWPAAFIGYCNLLDDKAQDMLDRLFDYPLTRGIRMQLHWHENELYSFANSPNIMDDRIFNKNFEYLMKYESVFELQVFQGQAESTKKLIKRYPEINFILQHAGMPHDLSEDRMKEWYDFIGNISEFDNLFIKLSGLGTFINKNDPKFINEIVNKVLNIYNSNRCLFGSNFPIEKIWCNYSDIIEAYQFATQKLQMSDKKNIFYETANRLYRL
ncbi:MAG: amidohydrolase family protein [Hyphomicrobiales bacterium]|jgi:predicted TIM-barrel fold metal-dependent hydrolase|nr:amidohydrolase family protein [Hyphomicrobiales bacterium]